MKFFNFQKFSCTIALFSIFTIGCANKTEIEQKNIAQCASYKQFASATFEVDGDHSQLIEKIAKKALTKSCFKKSDDSNANLRIKITSVQTLETKTGFIKDKHNNTLEVVITAIMLIPTEQGGLTTLTSKQNAKLNIQASPIADLGSKAELTEKEITNLVDTNVTVALQNLFNEIP